MQMNSILKKNSDPNMARLLAYVADLELEVDRLRRHYHFVHQAMGSSFKQIENLCQANNTPEDSPPWVTQVGLEIQQGLETLKDLRDNPGYHPSHDQVVAIAAAPLVKQAFRWQKRLQDAPEVALRFQMEVEHLDWFPARLRHIVENLIANALQFRDPNKEEMWIEFGLRTSPEAYEIQVRDNGIGLAPGECDKVFDLFFRSAPVRNNIPGVGLAVVRLLVEQSGGTMNVESNPGKGTKFVVVLPRYEVNDFLA